MKRIMISIPLELYFKIIETDLTKKRTLSPTITALLEAYLNEQESSISTGKINTLKKEIEQIKKQNIIKIIKKTKEKIKEEEERKKRKLEGDNMMEAMRRNNPMRHI